MKRYPIILKKDGTGYYVVIPDFVCGTQAKTKEECRAVAKDAIENVITAYKRVGMRIPEPGSRRIERECAEMKAGPGDEISWVDVNV